jgi:hypothetical protein
MEELQSFINDQLRRGRWGRALGMIASATTLVSPDAAAKLAHDNLPLLAAASWTAALSAVALTTTHKMSLPRGVSDKTLAALGRHNVDSHPLRTQLRMSRAVRLLSRTASDGAVGPALHLMAAANWVHSASMLQRAVRSSVTHVSPAGLAAVLISAARHEQGRALPLVGQLLQHYTTGESLPDVVGPALRIAAASDSCIAPLCRCVSWSAASLVVRAIAADRRIVPDDARCAAAHQCLLASQWVVGLRLIHDVPVTNPLAATLRLSLTGASMTRGLRESEVLRIIEAASCCTEANVAALVSNLASHWDVALRLQPLLPAFDASRQLLSAISATAPWDAALRLCASLPIVPRADAAIVGANCLAAGCGDDVCDDLVAKASNGAYRSELLLLLRSMARSHVKRPVASADSVVRAVAALPPHEVDDMLLRRLLDAMRNVSLPNEWQTALRLLRRPAFWRSIPRRQRVDVVESIARVSWRGALCSVAMVTRPAERAADVFDAVSSATLPTLIAWQLRDAFLPVSPPLPDRQSTDALRVFAADLAARRTPHTSTARLAMRQLSAAGNWAASLEVLEAHGGVASAPPELINEAGRCIRSYAAAHPDSQVWRAALHLAANRRWCRDTFAMTAGIAACGHSGEWRAALVLFDAYGVARPTRPDQVMFRTVVVAATPQWRAVLRLVGGLEARVDAHVAMAVCTSLPRSAAQQVLRHAVPTVAARAVFEQHNIVVQSQPLSARCSEAGPDDVLPLLRREPAAIAYAPVLSERCATWFAAFHVARLASDATRELTQQQRMATADAALRRSLDAGWQPALCVLHDLVHRGACVPDSRRFDVLEAMTAAGRWRDAQKLS